MASVQHRIGDGYDDQGTVASTPCSIAVSPHGKPYWVQPAHPNGAAYLEKHRALRESFARGIGHGLLALDAAAPALTEDASIAYWRSFVRRYLTALTAEPELEARDFIQDPLSIPLHEMDIAQLLLTLPPMQGGEYVDAHCLRSAWQALETALQAEIMAQGSGIAGYFAARHGGWNLLGKVCFHLAENKRDPEHPFAFLATYAHRVSGEGAAKHLPLGRALEEYKKQPPMLLRLLEPIHKASQECVFLKMLLDAGDIYDPQAWTAREAHQFLQAIPLFEASGIAVKVPNWWKAGNASRPEIKITIGEKSPTHVGADALLDLHASLVLDDASMSEKEIQDLLTRSENLIFFKGQWVEVDREKLTDLLGKWKSMQRQMQGGVSFGEAMRLMSGMAGVDANTAAEITAQTRVICGPWLEKTLQGLRNPEEDSALQKTLATSIRAQLRPYQQQGVAWLHLLHRLQLGAILADDMGLGKTLQVLSLLVLMQAKESSPALLIVPASLIGNWKAEIERFAPSLTPYIAHPSGDGLAAPADKHSIVMTTYSMVARLPWLAQHTWSLLVLDEAQAIKNPGAKQTRAVKALHAGHRLALTGTPVENRLSDLWSLFDFAVPGLLGSAKAFDTFMKRKDATGNPPHAALRTLTRPYILRRLKTDKRIISDLPDKTELKAYCTLTKAQAALYTQAVDRLAVDLRGTDDIQRKGVILSYLMRFKQICNHPSQWVKDTQFPPQESGKFQRLQEIAETIAAKQEKLLVFTQFQEMTAPLAQFLSSVFGREGLVLHGGTPVGKRTQMVKNFQHDDGPPFFVLSLKAGGTGLNLTAASHVIHFDRWWNPAVENQATDRAFRIGQKRNVLVHKFICKGTLEERIDAMIESKRALSDAVMEDTSGALLTELSDTELLQMVALDIKSAMS